MISYKKQQPAINHLDAQKRFVQKDNNKQTNIFNLR